MKNAPKIKSWERFQHFKDRKPPWIKLYRDLLDDLEWHELPGDDAKSLVMLWLIASENDGYLLSIKELSFRLRVSEKSMKSTISRLSHWLIQDDINLISADEVISEGYQDGISEIPLTRSQETEKESETEIAFNKFWLAYPKKEAKPAAFKSFKTQKINGILSEVLADIEKRKRSESWQSDGGKFIPYPATYLNNRRWEAPETTLLSTDRRVI